MSSSSLSPLAQAPYILGLSGSLRAESSNGSVIKAAVKLSRPDLPVVNFMGLGSLPFFNPDLETEVSLPPLVRAWRDQVAAATGLVISSPEYAHGLSGVLKNALDWLVGDPRFQEKPVLVINAYAFAVHAHAQLLEVLRTMNADLRPAEGLSLPWTGARLTLEAIEADGVLSGLIRDGLKALG
jgi:NAD(P)H-dependent FMN reductase